MYRTVQLSSSLTSNYNTIVQQKKTKLNSTFYMSQEYFRYTNLVDFDEKFFDLQLLSHDRRQNNLGTANDVQRLLGLQ